MMVKTRRERSAFWKNRYKKREKIKVGKKWFYAPGCAARYVDVTCVTLQAWAISCPWLNGEGVEMNSLEDGNSQERNYYSKKDLDRIKAAMARTPLIPKVPGYTHVLTAAKKLGVSFSGLHQLLTAHGDKTKPFPGKKKNGWPTNRSFVNDAFITKCLENQESREIPKGKLLVASAARLLRVKPRQVLQLIAQKKLTAEDEWLPTMRNAFRKGKRVRAHLVLRPIKLLSATEVAQLKKQRLSTPMPYVDDKGIARVHPKLASKINPAATEDLLRFYANKISPQIGGDVLIAEPTVWPDEYRHYGFYKSIAFRLDQIERFKSLGSGYVPDGHRKKGVGRTRSKEVKELYRKCHEACGQKGKRARQLAWLQSQLGKDDGKVPTVQTMLLYRRRYIKMQKRKMQKRR